MQARSSVFDRNQYEEVLRNVNIGTGGFNTEEFPPGTSGEKQLLDQIRSDTGIGID